MTPNEIDEIAEAAAERAVAKMMFSLGWDVSNNQAVEKVRADVAHVRLQREACETVKRHGMKTAITILGTFFVSAMGYIVMMFTKGGH